MPRPLREKLIVEKGDGIGRLVLNQPERRNAIGFAMWQGIGDVMADFADDPEVRVVIVSGAGDKAFSAGADISEFQELRSTVEGRESYDRAMRRAFEAMAQLPKLSIAMIDGVCVGGGAEVAMDCDVPIASDRSRFAIPAAKLGLGYALPDVERLVRHLGAKRAKEVLATGRFYGAQEALAMGLINHVVPADGLAAFVDDFAATVAANAPLSVRAAKLMVNQAEKLPADRDLDLCARLVEDCYGSEDYLEGQRAFAEKRTPRYRGR